MRARVTLATFVMTMAAVLMLSAGVDTAKAQQGAPAPAPASQAVETPTVVLDTYGIWRSHSQLAPPVLANGETAKLKFAWLNYETPAVAKGWMAPEFNDETWLRGPASLAPKTGLARRVCLRGKFTVTDPASVKGLTLSAGYRGGLIVHVNGKEVKREHLNAAGTLADGVAGEERSLESMAIPSGLLRKGLNVVGLEVVRAAYPEQMVDDAFKVSACEILRVRLTASGEAGLVPNATRPEGLQVWNADAMAVDFNLDFGDRAEGLRAVKIVGTRNGMFTGKVMVGSTKAINGLKTTASALRGESGVIPAANVEMRYGMQWGEMRLAGDKELSPYPAHVERLGALAEKAPEEIGVLASPVRSTRYAYSFPKDPGMPGPVPGAVVPVWIRVTVPGSVKAGTYSGTVKIEVRGEKAVTVPVEVRVADYALPDTQDFRTWVDLIQCPDTLALEYNVPLWSERHWEMIAHSFKLIGQTGARTVYIPLIAHTDLGNEESLVRWVRKAENQYEYDFSVMDKYLDVAEKNMGKPKLVVLVVWDVYMIPPKDVTESKDRQKQMAEYIMKTAGSIGSGPMVTTVDPATQKTELLMLPTHFQTEASKPLWKPLMDQLRARLAKRGLEDKAMLGMQGDAWASKEEHAFFKELSGGMPWILQSHEGFVASWVNMDKPNPSTKLMHGISQIGYQARVWAVTFSDDNADRPKGYKGGIQSHLGWARPDLVAEFDRFSRENHPTVRWLNMVETMITGAQRGPGRLGADYWLVVRDKKGQRRGRSHDRFPESTWRNLFIPEGLLAPGPDGPVASDELEAFREGVQECEARIAIERASCDDALKARIGDELAKRCEDYLYNRHMMLWLSHSSLQLRGKANEPMGTGGWRSNLNVGGANWFIGSGWHDRTAQLYELAGEVTAKLGGK